MEFYALRVKSGMQDTDKTVLERNLNAVQHRYFINDFKLCMNLNRYLVQYYLSL